MIVFGVWAEIVQASFFGACVSCCCCNTAIHRGHKVSLYLNQGNPDVAGLFTLLSVFVLKCGSRRIQDWDWDQGLPFSRSTPGDMVTVSVECRKTVP